MDSREYQRRDFPVMCLGCRRWMRHRPSEAGKRQYVQRRASPNAGRCVECPVKTRS